MKEFLKTRWGKVVIVGSIIWIPLILFFMNFTLTKSPGTSNMPTLSYDRWLLFMKTSNFHRGQFALVYPPKNAPNSISRFGTRLRYIKRILGVPGDRLWMKQGRFWLNGKRLEESYTIPYWVKDDLWDNSSYLSNSDTWVFWQNSDQKVCDTEDSSCQPRSILLKQDEYFVVGDNRSPGGSEDSRVFGAVEKADILGVLVSVGFPPKSLEIPQELK
jgi:signal peptidase I